MSTEIVKIGSKIYKFSKTEYETDESYFLRRDFFMSVFPQSQKDYLNAISMSIVWSSMKILGCTYNPEVVENINKLLNTSVKN
jgi:hypothetical protein